MEKDIDCSIGAGCVVPNDSNEILEKVINIPLVLENILTCMDWKTLCVARQASRGWYNCSQKTWRRLAPPIVLTIARGYRERMDVLNQLSLSSVNQEQEDYRWGGVNEYTNITLYGTELSMAPGVHFSFLRDRCHFIRHLHINTCDFSNVKAIKEIMCCKYTPQLTSLKLTNLICYSDNTNNKEGVHESQGLIAKKQQHEIEIGDYYSEVKSLTKLDLEYTSFRFPSWPLTWLEVLSKYPNLKKIRVAECDPEERKLIFTAMDNLIRNKKLLLLTNIDIADVRFELPWPLYESLQSLMSKYNQVTVGGLLTKLNSISIAINPNYGSKHLQCLLSLVAAKLIHLKINGSFSTSNRSLNIPVVMEKLETITLLQFHLKNLSFLTKTPKLKKLYIFEHRSCIGSPNVVRSTTIWDGHDECSNSSKMKGMCADLNTFACNHVVSYNHEDITHLKNWMPNLTTLKMHLNDTSFYAVCKYFPRIKRLHICQSKVTDNGYIGDKELGNKYYRARRDHYDYHCEISNSKNLHLYYPGEPDSSDNDEDCSVDVGENISFKDGGNNNYNGCCLEKEHKEEADKDNFGKHMKEAEEFRHPQKNYNLENKNKVDLEKKQKTLENKGFNSNNKEEVDENSQIKLYSNKKDSNNDSSSSSRSVCSITGSTDDGITQLATEENTHEVIVPEYQYDATSFQDMEVLVIEKCHKDYGRSGIVSTVSFCKSFRSLPLLQEVWLEDGVATINGKRYAIDCGLYRDYDIVENACRPEFID